MKIAFGQSIEKIIDTLVYQLCIRISFQYKIQRKLHSSSLKTLQTFTYAVTIIYIYFFIMTPEAERFNGWAAMLGFVAAIGAYVTTGQIIPGWF